MRAMTSRGGANASAAAGGRESLATDSCGLRPKRPFSGAAQASGAKFFSTGEIVDHRRCRAHDKSCGACVQRLLAQEINLVRSCGKPLFVDTFACSLFLRCVRALTRKLFAVRFIVSERVRGATRAARHLHTKLSGVTVIFLLL
ncbi:MAG: hypothetical protein KGK33_03725 [Hyphomicrobiales bacterium]|nr:hypothetical protein [Hyphomicrobiales bacterium]